MEARVLGAFNPDDWSSHDSFFGALGSQLHKMSNREDWYLEAFVPPFHKLSTHDDWFHPDTEQNKGISRHIPYRNGKELIFLASDKHLKTPPISRALDAKK